LHADEQAIRDLVANWVRATIAGDLPRLLSLVSEDVAFLAPGQAPLRGKEAFKAAFQSALGHVRITATSEIQEIRVEGGLAYCWNHFSVTTTPLDGSPAKKRSGHTLTILRKTRLGNWVLTRDANMLGPGS
jgi:uncharacterized protein (TIGR02246 family)